MTALRIDRCVCFDVTFERIALWAKEQPKVVEVRDATAQFGCGGRCKLCLAYVACTLRTGQVVYTEILTEPLAE